MNNNILKQVQKLQKEMMETKNQIDQQEFVGKSSFVTVIAKGTKEIINIQIDKQKIDDSEEIEILQDMLVIATNNAFQLIDKTIEEKMGKYTQGMPGLF